MSEVLIIDAVRSPIGKRGGSLSQVRPDDLAGFVIAELVRRSGVVANEIEDVVLGCVTQVEEQGWNIARLASLIAGLPQTVPATTVNRMCGSGQQAVHFAAQSIASGDMDLAIAAGVESMSRVKMGSDGKDFSPALMKRFDLVWQGTSAEMMAKKWGLTRQDLDQFSLESHRKAIDAWHHGRFRAEVAALNVSTNCEPAYFDRDEGPRADTSADKLAALKPAFADEGVITAGNSSQISDGAAAVLLASPKKATELGLSPKARIKARTVVGSDPILMLDGVIPATEKALRKAGLAINDIDVFEVNEAFACVPLAWAAQLKVDSNKINPNGGGIALGHPLGASGTRLLTSLVYELERRNAQFGLQVMCVAHGMATATVIERL